ncbi:MAG: SDR family NAD(P)-dependent oxidoreductase [Thalassobaculum sp.]|uniref:SDR family oxidoreductase n=1 Tax=Thalassobaculum sp. TaxID=2022740 RepID=UPI0032EBA59B
MSRTHNGRVAVVTGGGSGIGRAIAEALAAAGAAVAVLDANGNAAEDTAGAIAAAGHRAMAVACDVARFDAVESAGREVAANLGPVDILISNAGISPKHDGRPASVLEMDPAEWQRVVDVNLTGAFHGARVFGPDMARRGWGAIVNQSSVAAKTHVDFVGVHYPATKAGLIGLTKHLAGELGPMGINVNALAPGRIDTPLMRGVATAVNDAIVADTPMRRLGTAADVAAAALFLTSEAGHFITGQVVDVAGGWKLT